VRGAPSVRESDAGGSPVSPTRSRRTSSGSGIAQPASKPPSLPRPARRRSLEPIRRPSARSPSESRSASRASISGSASACIAFSWLVPSPFLAGDEGPHDLDDRASYASRCPARRGLRPMAGAPGPRRMPGAESGEANGDASRSAAGAPPPATNGSARRGPRAFRASRAEATTTPFAAAERPEQAKHGPDRGRRLERREHVDGFAPRPFVAREDPRLEGLHRGLGVDFTRRSAAARDSRPPSRPARSGSPSPAGLDREEPLLRGPSSRRATARRGPPTRGLQRATEMRSRISQASAPTWRTRSSQALSAAGLVILERPREAHVVQRSISAGTSNPKASSATPRLRPLLARTPVAVSPGVVERPGDVLESWTA
jgi:hypothetical protein